MPMFKSLRRFSIYLLMRTLVKLAEVLPRSVGRATFALLGAVAYSFMRGSRRIALANLALVYGQTCSDKDIRDTARAAFTNLGRFACDAARMRKQTFQGLDRMVKVVGKHYLDDALAKGKGIIAITGHVGNWELLGAYLSLAGYPINVLATGLKDSRLNNVLIELRRSAGLRVLERTHELIGAVRCLKKGQVLGVLIDQDTSVESVVVDFLGCPAKTAVGFVKLAARTGAALIPMAMLMTEGGRYEIEVCEPVDISGDIDSLEEDVEKCSKAVESFILKEPSQWVWMHKRWKSVFSEIYV
jgi:KDO2-lipid IV(A) lauroyltransferase